MPAALLFSTPNEAYLDHTLRCKDKFDFVFPRFNSAISRVFGSLNTLENYLLKMILFHDLGKLTRKWQENVGTNRRSPAHATIGAAYLYRTLPEGIREPLSFAVAIHHTDRGLLGDNIERPDVQAILDGIVDNDGKIQWHDEVSNLLTEYFPEEIRELDINSLKEMARGLRTWARGSNLHEQHQRRLQASLAHHILKLCDISAATEREEYKKKDNHDYYGGWLMVEKIRNYVGNIKMRGKV